MADVLLRSDITVTVDERWIEGRKRYIRGSMAFGDGYKTLPLGGITVPTLATFGFHRQIDELRFQPRRGEFGRLMYYDKGRNVILPNEEAGESYPESAWSPGTESKSAMPANNTDDTVLGNDEAFEPILLDFYAVGW